MAIVERTHIPREAIKYDDWLKQFDEIILNCRTPIIDLGCGRGNDTKYLLEKNKDVIPCDCIEATIENIKRNFPEVKRAECFDMTQKFPFTENCTDIVIADLSLHYFDEKTTYKILDDIKTILNLNGLLIFRVNSINDFNHGAGMGSEIEKHFYQSEERGYKRFFDEEDIKRFFSNWNIIHMNEETMYRYEKPKELWKCAAKVIK